VVEFISILKNLFHVLPQFAVSPVAIVSCLQSSRMAGEDRKIRVCVFRCMYVCIMYVSTYACMYVRVYLRTCYLCMYACT